LKNPKTAYILLWFPKPSEIFIFREVANLKEMGLPLVVFFLYGKLHRGLSKEMRSASDGVFRLGVPFLKKAHKDLFRWWKKEPKKLIRILKSLFVKPYYGVEKTGENLWAFLCALHLANRFKERGIRHIHAPWACGPATAAWIASRENRAFRTVENPAPQKGDQWRAGVHVRHQQTVSGNGPASRSP